MSPNISLIYYLVSERQEFDCRKKCGSDWEITKIKERIRE